MGDPREVYVYLAAQIQRYAEAATAAAAAPAMPTPAATTAATTAAATPAAAAAAATAAPRQQQHSKLTAKGAADEAAPKYQGVLGDTPEQALQFLHQVVQALSIALLSAKVSNITSFL